jgi:hypothetical protein
MCAAKYASGFLIPVCGSECEFMEADMTDITFPYPKCGRYVSIHYSTVGMKVSCPSCAEQIAVPTQPPKMQAPAFGLLSVVIPCAGLALSLCAFCPLVPRVEAARPSMFSSPSLG